MRVFFLGLFLFGLFGCSTTPPNPSGKWFAEIPTSIGILPFELEISEDLRVFAINGEERLALDTAWVKNDSLFIRMDVFEAIIKAKISSHTLEGTFSKKLGNLEDRSGAFYASREKESRFGPVENTSHSIEGKYEVTFTTPDSSSYPAVGVFKQKGSIVTGTFLTETGDYRFLAGQILGDSLLLSCFDGTHVFLFKAAIEEDKLQGGKFSSSLQYEETWVGKKNLDAKLRDPESLTTIKEGYEGISFAFSTTKGDSIRFPSSAFENRVTVLQILGSWCPNCMDETKFLSAWSRKNPEVAIVGLAFEKSLDPAYAFPKIDKMVKRFDVPYPIVLAGLNDKTEAAKSLPMLSAILSFPTTIILDKKGNVRKIHTGFSGPGTGEYYTTFTENFDRYLQKLKNE